MTELKPCPFCGGEAEALRNGLWWCVACRTPFCCDVGKFETEAEAIEAWNTRAAYEMEDWFYLPKPKEQLYSYTTGFTFDELSLKATGAVDVYALINAVRKWQEEELNQHIVERICEVFKPEQTCEFIDDSDGEPSPPKCSVCGYDPGIYECAWYEDGTYGYERNYCPNCGARVEVGE